MSSNTAALVERLKAAIKLGDMTGARGLRPENIYNVAAEAADALSAQAKELEEARGTLRNGADLDVIRKAYLWAIDVDGHVMGLVAGDMGFDNTGIVIDPEHLQASKLAVSEAERERDEALAALKASEAREAELRAGLQKARSVLRNAWGAVTSNQVVDKQVDKMLRKGIEAADATILSSQNIEANVSEDGQHVSHPYEHGENGEPTLAKALAALEPFAQPDTKKEGGA